MNLAVKREWLFLAIGGAQVIDEFERGRFAQVVVEAERLEIIGIDARDETQLHPPAHDLVDQRDLLGETQGMIERHVLAARSDAHPVRARRSVHDIDTWRGNPAFVRTEMVLDAEPVLKIEFVAELKLAPQLLVALVRAHIRLGPDMGKMS